MMCQGAAAKPLPVRTAVGPVAMGIVSFCPSGHRVKVKDHLAGKKGICPHCGATFRIPAAVASGDPSHAVGSGLPPAAVVSLDPLLAASLPQVIALADVPPASAAAAVEPVVEVETFALPTEEAPVPRAIADAPGATWCWALPGGQPSPQMHADGMREWLGSGAMTGAELVWRSDWTNWAPVRDVFPEAFPAVSGRDFHWP